MARVEKAVAVHYRDELPAPIVLASGKGVLAKAIKRIAEENGVVLVENPELADALLTLEVGSLIPESLYAVIAEILVFVRGVGAAGSRK